MSERKVLNKYYPPDFDPSKIPRGKRSRNATFNIRIMAPFNMRCNTCKDYIYKGKKFNSRKEDVMDEFYLGLRIFRFYIKCPRCVSEIAFKTDIENIDYTLEAGATRLFEAEKLARKMEEEERKQIEEDELNPMKVLENRTKASIAEMDQIDSLEELREINSRKNVVNTEEMLEKYRKYEQLLQQLQMEEEEKEIREIFGSEGMKIVKRLHDSDDEDEPATKKAAPSLDKPTDILAQDSKSEIKTAKKPEVWERSIGSLSSKQKLSGLVVKKKNNLPSMSVASKTSSQESNSNTENKPDSKPSLQEKLTEEENSSANPSSALSDNSIQSANQMSSPSGSKDGNYSVTVIKEYTDGSVDKNKQEKQSQIDNSATVVTGKVGASGLGSGGLGLLGAYSNSESNESD